MANINQKTMEYKSENKICQNCKLGFVVEPDDFSFYEKIKVPAPTWCPECRYKRRIAWRNVRYLARGKDAITGKEIFTGIPPESGLIIYDLPYWNSDKWDALDYGVDYNFDKTFFEQFKRLLFEVPFGAVSKQRNINSDYSNQCDDMKNAYLCFNAGFCEDCAYSCNIYNLKNCFDLTSCYDCEFCYENTRVEKSYSTVGSIMSESCIDVYFSKNCVGCNNCFGCVNLRNSSYKIFNEQYTKEEYFKKIELFKIDTWDGFSSLREKSEDFWSLFPIKYMLGSRNLNALGEDIKECKNVIDCYIVHKSENLKYSQDLFFGEASESYDYTVWGKVASQIYECIVVGENVDRIKFCYDCWPSCQELEYCINLRRSKNCFGCVGLKDKQYCVFNKQYTKEQYFELVDKIKKQMNKLPYIDKHENVYKYGEFFPSEISPFAYNETLLNDQFPLDKEEVEDQGHVWRDKAKKEFKTTILASDLPSSINDVDEKIVNEIIKCQKCGSAYRIILDEFHFLKKINLPLPRDCSDCRFYRRQKFMVPPVFVESQCMCNGGYSLDEKYKNNQNHDFHKHERCQNKFKTAYDIDKEIIYCEECYKKEVF